MSSRRLARIGGVLVVTACALLSAPIGSPAASADPCSDVAVVFARGTHQDPGLGNVGQAFVDSLTSQVGGRSVDVYAVNYPANDDYHNSAYAGSNDASAHIQDTVASCPNTKIVLGGYSQGSTVIDLASTAMPARGGRSCRRSRAVRRAIEWILDHVVGWPAAADNQPAVRRQDHQLVRSRRSNMLRRRQHHRARFLHRVRDDKPSRDIRGRQAQSRASKRLAANIPPWIASRAAMDWPLGGGHLDGRLLTTGCGRRVLMLRSGL